MKKYSHIAKHIQTKTKWKRHTIMVIKCKTNYKEGVSDWVRDVYVLMIEKLCFWEGLGFYSNLNDSSLNTGRSYKVFLKWSQWLSFGKGTKLKPPFRILYLHESILWLWRKHQFAWKSIVKRHVLWTNSMFRQCSSSQFVESALLKLYFLWMKLI